jgi:hypothetical protein
MIDLQKEIERIDRLRTEIKQEATPPPRVWPVILAGMAMGAGLFIAGMGVAKWLIQ